MMGTIRGIGNSRKIESLDRRIITKMGGNWMELCEWTWNSELVLPAHLFLVHEHRAFSDRCG